MGLETEIEWADDTWNPAIGCSKVSPGCQNCYMMRDQKRYGRDGTVVRRASPGTFDLPIKKDRAGAWKIAPGRLVFTASLTDVFHEDIDPFRDEMWAIMQARPDVLFLVLTKRPERIKTRLPSWWGPHGPANVALGVSTENQKAWDTRVPLLLDVVCRLRFASAEPMLGAIDPGTSLGPERQVIDTEYTADGSLATGTQGGIGWLIVGGESGPNARPMHPKWARDLIEAAVVAGAGVNFKQWGEWKPICYMPESEYDSLYVSNKIAKEGEDQGALDESYGRRCTVPELILGSDGVHLPTSDRRAFWEGRDSMHAFRVGKKRAGRTIRGRTYDDRPTWPLEVR